MVLWPLGYVLWVDEAMHWRGWHHHHLRHRHPTDERQSHPEDVWLSFAWSWIRDLKVFQPELWVVNIHLVLFLQFFFDCDHLFLDLSSETVLDHLGWYSFHPKDVHVYFVSLGHGVRYFLESDVVDLYHMCGE